MDPNNYQILIGDFVTTTDSNTPAPVSGIRSGSCGEPDRRGHCRQRPFILVDGAWYYPHELEPACQPPTAPLSEARASARLDGETRCVDESEGEAPVSERP